MKLPIQLLAPLLLLSPSLDAQTCEVDMRAADLPIAEDELGKTMAVKGTLAVVGSNTYTYVYDTTTGDELHRWNYQARSVAFDGTHVLARGTSLALFDATTGAPVPGFSTPYSTNYLAMDGNLILVGRPLVGAGEVLVLDKMTGDHLFTLTPDDGVGGDQFGRAVALHGTTAVVGAPFRESDILQPESFGAAYIFDLTTGTQVAQLIGTSVTFDSNEERFGWSVAANGSRIAVGAPFFSVSLTGTPTGAVYLYDTAGQFLDLLTGWDTTYDDEFGAKVSMDDDVLLVGAPDHSDEDSFAGGAAYLFDADSGTQIVKLIAAPPGTNGSIGRTVAVGDGVALVGVPTSDVAATDAGMFAMYDVQALSQPAQVTFYNGSGINQDQLEATPARFGFFFTAFLTPRSDRGPGSWSLLVRTATTSGIVLDLGTFFGLPAAGDSELLVAGGFLNNHGPILHSGAGVVSTWSTLIPNRCELFGLDWSAQAIVFGDLPGTGGIHDPHFSSAVAGTIGSWF